ncbi:hypothetical protein QBC37DRAFT_387241 [Rhypophila decipiens]|uniref:Uncharacterized protein n=1 Tax=Rhypophila decipiens TaxID=261697 RepID=A0AAN7BAX3_9PEZI|nr:hypothetical protein QBC37DRAFT_387241 [Rhypophila decipiens]
MVFASSVVPIYQFGITPRDTRCLQPNTTVSRRICFGPEGGSEAGPPLIPRATGAHPAYRGQGLHTSPGDAQTGYPVVIGSDDWDDEAITNSANRHGPSPGVPGGRQRAAGHEPAKEAEESAQNAHQALNKAVEVSEKLIEKMKQFAGKC